MTDGGALYGREEYLHTARRRRNLCWGPRMLSKDALLDVVEVVKAG